MTFQMNSSRKVSSRACARLAARTLSSSSSQAKDTCKITGICCTSDGGARLSRRLSGRLSCCLRGLLPHGRLFCRHSLGDCLADERFLGGYLIGRRLLLRLHLLGRGLLSCGLL